MCLWHTTPHQIIATLMLRHFYNVIEVQYDTNLLVFDIFHSRAAWWLQRRPRKRFRRQRQQEPRPDLLRRTHKRRVHIAHRTASHQDFFPTPPRTIFHLLNFFFIIFFLTCTEDFYLLCFGRGGEFCLQNIRKQTFLLATSAFTSCILLMCGHKKKNVNVFLPLEF